ncbi:hypothetical protein J7643_19055 [bacterium]|nr:hypothetical protein [bacterium]
MFGPVKRIATLAIVAATAMAAVTLVPHQPATAQTAPEGWYKAGSKPEAYAVGLDQSVRHGKGASAYLKSVTAIRDNESFGTLMQTFSAREYRGKRVRMSAFVKSKDVKDWAGLWMRVDGPEQAVLSFDNMQERPIKGTSDWKKYEIVLDVPQESEAIAFGLLLSKTGETWVDDFKFELAGNVPPTKPANATSYRRQPVNLNFER